MIESHAPPSKIRPAPTEMPALFQNAYRICFLSAALWAACAVPLWLLAYSGNIRIGGPYGAVNWHAHELIFGYAAMVVCGFLFTAIPNWTGRLPLSGWPLVCLVAIWLAGRITILAADSVGVTIAALIDCLFLTAVLASAMREIIAGKNWRNMRVLVLVFFLWAANIWFHVAIVTESATDFSLRAAIGALVMLITLVGGRIVPSFTHNWLVKRGADRLPAPFGRFDILAMAASAAGIVAWIAAPASTVAAILALIAAAFLTLRLARWRGWMTRSEPLLLILHFGYGFLPLGFLLHFTGHVMPGWISADAATHAWTVGAIGVMTLAVMTRASLGHSGMPLTADHATVLIYAAILLAAGLRITAGALPDWYLEILTASAAMWITAFSGFALTYGPILASSRR